MKQPLRIGVMGAGAVGCFVGGRLAAAGADVVLVGRAGTKTEVEKNGLTCIDLDGTRVVARDVRFETDAGALGDRDVVLCCVKSAATRAAADEMERVLPPEAIVVSLQNGVRNPEVLRAQLRQKVLAGVVAFNVVDGDGAFRRATEGELLIEASSDPKAVDLERWLASSGVGIETSDAIVPLQWSKLVINLNNGVSALSGRPTREIVLTRGYRVVLGALMSEALGVLHGAGIRPAKLTAVPMGWLPLLLRLPTPAVRAFSRTQLRIDPEARSSMYADLARGRATEVDFLNGEIVRLGEKTGVPAPLNQRIVELVHEAEKAGKGSPGLSPEALAHALYVVK